MVKIINNKLLIKEILSRLNNAYEVHKFKQEEYSKLVCSSCGFLFTIEELNYLNGNLQQIKIIRNAVDCIPNKK